MISIGMIQVGDDRSTLLEQLRELRQRVEQLEAEAAELKGLRSRQQGEVIREIADRAPVMLWVSGPDGSCTYFNKPWLAFRGRTLEEEAGNGWTEGVHPEDRERCLGTYMQAFHTRREFQMEYRLQRADGEYRWILDTGGPCFSPDGTFEGYMGSGVDISGQRPQPAGRMPLTEREKQVLVLIADGKSTKEAAAALGISYKTADSHRSKMMEKLDVHETASLVRYAIRQGMIKP